MSEFSDLDSENIGTNIDPTIKQIDHISQILDIIDELDGKIIVGLDWDNCISLVDSCNRPLRDPLNAENSYENGDGKLVLDTFDELNRRMIPFFVITSRLKGYNISDIVRRNELFPNNNIVASRVTRTLECIKENVRAMHDALPPLAPQYDKNQISGLNPKEPRIMLHKRNGTPYASSIFFENVIFAGSQRLMYPSNKGGALTNYMRLGIIPSNFDYFIFVDNEMRHIQNVISAFEDDQILDKLISVYYPQQPLLTSRANRDLCTDYHLLEDCLRK